METEALIAAGVDVRRHALLRDYTTLRLGGPCPALLNCQTPGQVTAAVRELVRQGREFRFLGGGSNLLASDRGAGQAVVRYVSDAPRIDRAGDELSVAGGASLDAVVRYAVDHALDGLEFATGIPGTLGGAVFMNAGAFGRQIGDVLVAAILMDRQGRIREVGPAELDFAYRYSNLQESGDIVLSARLRVGPGDADRLRREERRIRELRAAKHPDLAVEPSAGSFFKNIEPTSAAGRRQAAGWFLEQAGCLSLSVGGARVYKKHANIIVAGPGSTAMDVRGLSERMAAAVKARFGLVLRREVRLFGDW